MCHDMNGHIFVDQTITNIIKYVYTHLLYIRTRAVRLLEQLQLLVIVASQSQLCD